MKNVFVAAIDADNIVEENGSGTLKSCNLEEWLFRAEDSIWFVMQQLKSTTHTQRVDVRVAIHWQLLAFNSIVYYVIIYSLRPSTWPFSICSKHRS